MIDQVQTNYSFDLRISLRVSMTRTIHPNASLSTSVRIIFVQLLSLPFVRFTLEPVTRRQSFVFVSTAVRVRVVIDTIE
ncbi:hypothetical protein M6B38_401915 [Iris pallida]|uniref:Uncharacterized protein n=1 Tax=Iris pallida TaxID=29817 RepID=A0AAX6FTU1_IRIPA|nr:hypothetical protein M6B38_401915 [Iris pallida]